MTKTNLWSAGADGYFLYRIPALLVTRGGTLLAFCEGRRNSADDDGDIDLLVKRSADGGRTWSEQRLVWAEPGPVTIGNPCPVEDGRTGAIWLPFCRDNDRVFVTSSADDGATWSRPREITRDVKRAEWSWYATGPGVGIRLERGDNAGRIVVPCDHVSPEYGHGSHAIYSDDDGATWALGGVIKPGCDECQVVERADGSLLMNMRMEEGRRGCRAVAESADGGQSWTALAYEETLPCPTCQASLVRGTLSPPRDRNRLLFSNPATSDERRMLTVRVSYDEGRTWPVAKVLHEGPASYSCLAALPDGRIGCLYEGGETECDRIIFARFSWEWLEER